MAEGLLRRLAEQEGEDVEAASAGLGAMEGMPPSEHSVTAMREEGIDISGQRSRMLTSRMVEDATHVFGMGSGHVETIRAHFPDSWEKVFVLREFVAEEGLDLNVPDPIGGDLEEYRLARNLIKEAMPSVLRFVTTGDPQGRKAE